MNLKRICVNILILHIDIISSIKETKDITEETENALNEALTAFVKKFLEAK